MADRFVAFHAQFQSHFQRGTRSVFKAASHYLKGLIQAERKNMERMEEAVVGADDQQLQHMLTNSKWDHRAVLDQVAQEADRHLGGSTESCLLIDESGVAKKGKHSVGVARQWCGRLGKVDNCQVGVFAALGRGHLATLTDVRLFLPEAWVADGQRCKKAGIPDQEQVYRSKAQLGLAMVDHQRTLGVRFSWVGADGGYGKDPAFLRGLEDRKEVFVVDVHKDQRIYLEDPQPVIAQVGQTGRRGRKPKKLKTQLDSHRVDQWVSEQSASDWIQVEVRDSTQGQLKIHVLHKRVWLWDGKETQAHCWHLIVRREPNDETRLKYTLSNADESTPIQRLALMQAQRFWVERSLQDGKSECGLADYQARKWTAWHHHMALVMMAMLFMLEERIRQQDDHPLLSCSDIESLLRTFLPRRDLDRDEVIRQMEKRHKKRQASTDSCYWKQRESPPNPA